MGFVGRFVRQSPCKERHLCQNIKYRGPPIENKSQEVGGIDFKKTNGSQMIYFAIKQKNRSFANIFQGLVFSSYRILELGQHSLNDFSSYDHRIAK